MNTTKLQGIVGGLALLTSLGIPTAAAGASSAPGVLCRAAVSAVVYSPNTWQPKYVISAGHDMRVHSVSNGWFYGHSATRNDDGWANSANFAYCR